MLKVENKSMLKTGFVWNERYMWHDTGNAAGIMPAGFDTQPLQHVENPETKRRFKNLLDASGLINKLQMLNDRPITDEEILQVHTKRYLAHLKKTNETGGDAGPFTPMGRGSLDIARLAAGGVLELVSAVVKREVKNGYALVRPPGHHAVADSGMGFCLLSNAAIATKYAIYNLGVEKVAFIDWDVHHGNGAESIFYQDPNVLTISVHQNRCFPPDTGDREAIGEGKGKGRNLNIPLPAGSGLGAYIATFERVVIPALNQFKPDLIIVPSGFDAGIYDPLGRQMMTSSGYRRLTEMLLEAADTNCGGRLAMCHEGGYNPSTVPYHGLAVMEALSGENSGMSDPFTEIHDSIAGQDLNSYQDLFIKKAESLLTEISAMW
jgi:acetoin utilization deacetylase AcuC-like enzyme